MAISVKLTHMCPYKSNGNIRGKITQNDLYQSNRLKCVNISQTHPYVETSVKRRHLWRNQSILHIYGNISQTDPFIEISVKLIHMW